MRISQLWIGAVFLASALVSACSSEPVTPDAWKIDHVEQEGALLSVWGSGEDDVWAAGGQVGEVGKGLMLHNDGTGWQPVETGATELLWWVYGFQSDDVYAVGEGGLILHYDGASWERIESGTDQTLFGVWGASGGDVWIVGGDVTGPAGSAVVLRGNASSFRAVDDLSSDLLPNALFKVYGGPQGLLTVGTSGTVLRFDGDTWSREQTPTEQSIFSLWGRADDDVYAVGGAALGEVLHFDGQHWHKLNEDALGRGLSGVFTAPDHPMIAVGPDAYVLEIQPDGSQAEPQLPLQGPAPALHGVWGDGTGTAYAVGGDIYAYPGPMSGVIYRRN